MHQVTDLEKETKGGSVAEWIKALLGKLIIVTKLSMLVNS